MGKKFYEEGLQFQCQGSGNCCVSRGEYGFVFLTLEDRKNLAKSTGLSLAAFTKKYCDRTKGIWHLKEDPSRMECAFLKNNRCSVYEGRPTQCKTWPFWPEVMNAKTWKKEVATFCPGVGKGKIHSKTSIEKQLKIQQASEDSILEEAQSFSVSGK